MKLYNNYNVNYLDVFFNPFYILRSSLLLQIKTNAKSLHGNILDFGCGTKPYRDYFVFDDYIGLDLYSPTNSNVNLADYYYDGLVVPFKDNYFDSFFSSEVFEHVFNLEDMLSEIRRVLKKDANGLLTIPFNFELHEEPYDYARYTPYSLKFLLEKSGFEVLNIIPTTSNFSSLLQQVLSFLYLHFIPTRFLKLLLGPIYILPINLIHLFSIFLKVPNKGLHTNPCNYIVLFKKI